MLIEGLSQKAPLREAGFRSNPDGSMICVEDLHQRLAQDQHPSSNGTSEGRRDHHSGLVECFCQHTSAHGFRCVVRPERNKFMRLVWALAITVASLSLAGTLFELWERYHTYPVKTIVDVKYATELPFPSVTVCNIQSFPCWRGALLQNVTDGAKKICDMARYESLSKHPNEKGILSNPYYNDIMQVRASEIFKIMMMYGNNTLRVCKWNSVEVPCAEVFRHMYDMEGSCFQFNYNASSPLFTSSVGPQAGLSLLVAQPDSDMQPTYAGIKVLLHPPGTYPNMLTQSFLVSPGFTTFGRITLRKASHLPYPYRSFGDNYCQVSPNADRDHLYTHEECTTECAYNQAVRKCNCTFRPEAESTSSNECTLRQAMSCVRPIFEKIFNTAGINKAMCPSCNYSCDAVTFSLSTSQATYLDPDLAEMHPGGGETSAHKHGFKYLELRLFYDQLSHDDIKYEPEYTWHTVLGTIGGQMGLFMGASAMTVLEILECLCSLVFRLCVRVYKALMSKGKSKSTTNDCSARLG